jgi:hypothetical protein
MDRPEEPSIDEALEWRRIFLAFVAAIRNRELGVSGDWTSSPEAAPPPTSSPSPHDIVGLAKPENEFRRVLVFRLGEVDFGFGAPSPSLPSSSFAVVVTCKVPPSLRVGVSIAAAAVCGKVKVASPSSPSLPCAAASPGPGKR